MSEAENSRKQVDRVDGEFAISGTLDTIQDVIDFKEGLALFNYGYYRFVEHPYLRQLQAGLKQHFSVRHCLLTVSLQTAILELFEYLYIDNPNRRFKFISDPTHPVYDIASSLFEDYESTKIVGMKALNSVSTRSTILDSKDVLVVALDNPARLFDENASLAEETKHLRIPVIFISKTVPDSRQDLNGADFWITGLNGRNSSVTGGAILSNSDRKIMGLQNRLKRNGPLLSSRNAAQFLGKDVPAEPAGFEAACQQISKLEDGYETFLFPSGMNAIVTLLNILRSPGQSQVISIGHLYNDTYVMLSQAARGESDEANVFLSVDQLDELEEQINRQTAAIITESITNPLNDVPDLERIAKIAQKHQVPFIVDNTVATPHNVQPLSLGADYVVHSTTKYLNGENNHGGGSITIRDASPSNDIAQYQSKWKNYMSPLESAILAENIHDLHHRMQQFNHNALEVAHFLEDHEKVAKVYYSMLPSHESHQVAQQILQGGSSLVSFNLRENSMDGLQRFYDTDMPHIPKAPTLGSNKTLICPYTLLTHYTETDEYLDFIGLSRYLVRVAVGCEDDLAPIISDLEAALDNV